MMLTKLGTIATRLVNNNVLLQRLAVHKTKSLPRCLSNQSMSPKSKSDEEDIDAPIQYSSSEAAKWKVEYTRQGEPSDEPWYQPYVIIVSVATFLIYFCVLREENDVDKKLTLELSDHFEAARKRELEESLRIPQNAHKNR